MSGIHYKREYEDSYFKVQVSEYEWVTEKGLCLICDGDYHKWRCLQCQLKHALDHDEMNWSGHLESVRKDVECTFGSLKRRFLILKHALQLHSLLDTDATMFTCCVIHNMLLEIDGFTTKWDTEDFLRDDNDIHENEYLATKQKHNANATRLYLSKHKKRVEESLLRQAAGDFTRVGHTENDVSLRTEVESIETETSYQILQSRLITHFKYQYADGKVQWLK